MLADFEGNEQTNVCVASFSTVSDSLPQWRAYGGQNSAFAVGINGDHIISLLPKHHFHLVPCIYDRRKQRDLIAALIAKVYDEILKARRTGKVHPRKGGNLTAYLHRYAPILKDSAFSDEHEWRIVSRPLMNGLDGFAFSRLRKNTFRVRNGKSTSRLEAHHAIADPRVYILLPPISPFGKVQWTFSATC